MPYLQQCRKRKSVRSIAKLTRIRNKRRADHKSPTIKKMDVADEVIEKGMLHPSIQEEIGTQSDGQP